MAAERARAASVDTVDTGKVGREAAVRTSLIRVTVVDSHALTINTVAIASPATTRPRPRRARFAPIKCAPTSSMTGDMVRQPGGGCKRPGAR